MTTSSEILMMVREACYGRTDALTRVYGPGDWPSQSDTMPILKLRLLSEDRQCLSRNGPPEFTTTASIRIIGEVSAAAAEDDAGATVAETALWFLKRQVEVAVINSYPLTRAIQQIATVRSQIAFNADSELHLASIQMDLAIEFFESAEDFAEVYSAPLTSIGLTAENYAPANTSTSLT